MLYNSTTIII